MSARKADYQKFEALNIQILGISSNNPFSQKTFADSLQLPYPPSADFCPCNFFRYSRGAE